LIKPLLDELKKLNLYDQTMLIITADHGEAFGEHGYWMHSWNIYNEVARVPLIIKFPRSRHRGRIIHDFVGTIDILPTILDEANISGSGSRVDGESLLNILNQKKKKPKPYLIYQPAYMTAAPTPRRIGLFLDPFKLVINEDYPPQAYKWFSPPPPREEDLELYDLRRDPGEKKNLAGLKRNVVQELISKVQVLLKDLEKERSVRKLPLDRDLLERLRALGYIE
jgi:arylsulfatase A-like enzyme